MKCSTYFILFTSVNFMCKHVFLTLKRLKAINLKISCGIYVPLQNIKYTYLFKTEFLSLRAEFINPFAYALNK